MKHLGKIEIGGSLDITNNKHVEELLEEALKGIEIPEDTNTTYTLTQDGLKVQLVDDGGQTVSEIEIPEPEYKDPHQEVIEITIPPANLLKMLISYDEFDITSEFDAENDLISIYLHLYEKGIERKFTLADNVSNLWPILNKTGETTQEIHITKVSSTKEDVTIEGTDSDGSDDEVRIFQPKVQNARDSELDSRYHRYGTVITNAWGNMYFYFPNDPLTTESEPTVITATLEEHLQNLYEQINQ